MEEVKKNIKRPGGFEITSKALSFCSFKKGSRIIDLGCGSGATVDFLTSEGFEAYGIDNDTKKTRPQINLINGSAEKIPFPESSVDGVFMECSFTLMNDQRAVLNECYRVLKPGGRLVISSLYARGDPAYIKDGFGHIDRKEDIVLKIENNGFDIELFEDHSGHLPAMWGQMIFERGLDSLYNSLGVDHEKMKSIKAGYFLLIAVIKK